MSTTVDWTQQKKELVSLNIGQCQLPKLKINQNNGNKHNN